MSYMLFGRALRIARQMRKAHRMRLLRYGVTDSDYLTRLYLV